MDNRVTVGIHQPNFMPWLGYFYKIWQSDTFIFLDDVQFIKTGSSYTNRVAINISSQSNFITIPVKRGSGVQNIDKTEFINEKWKKKVIGTLQANYAKSPFFQENRELIFELINFKANSLADYNIHFIETISNKLKLNTHFIRSSTFNIQTKSTQRLVELIKKVDATIYLSGKGANEYQEHDIYKKSNITIKYNKIPNFKYKQTKTEEFIFGLSIIDAIFNIGFENLKFHLFTHSKG
jgi:hypothetical protein